jgi:hypothetical protein
MTAVAPTDLREDAAPHGELEVAGRAWSGFRERCADPWRRPPWAIPPQVLARDQVEADEMGLRLVALLGREGRSRTWLASGTGGEARVARRLPQRSSAELGPEVTELVRLVSLREPSLLTPTQVLAGDPTWVVRRFSEGVPLRRLLMIAGLSEVQVATVVQDLAAALAALHAAGLAHGSVHSGNAIVGIDGITRLCDAATRPVTEPGEAAMARDVAALRGVVEAALTRRSGVGSRVRSHDGRARLDGVLAEFAATPHPGRSSLDALRVEVESIAGSPGTAVRRQVSALVARVLPRPATPPPGLSGGPRPGR